MKPKVLIADDLTQITDLVEVILGKKGITVVKVHNTRDIIEVALDNPDIDLLILDKDCFGEGSVVDTVRRLCDGIKIVLWSGGFVGDENPADYDVDAVVPKGTSPVEILDRLIPWPSKAAELK